MTTSKVTLIKPGQFEPNEHWYDKALNAQIHPLIQFFLNLSADRIIDRYIHLHPKTNRQKLADVLAYQPRHFAWSGADLFHVTSASGKRQMIVVETNSCPSGQKSMPLIDEQNEMGGYRRLIDETFLPRLSNRRKLPGGNLAVLYDKNVMEAQGYASALAELTGEAVYFVPCHHQADFIRVQDRVLEICDGVGQWREIRAAFRYVTQQPWNRLPISSRTFIFNPIIACLAGGRNKMTAAKAYEFYNAELEGSGLQILTPETIWDVSQEEIPLWVQRLGGHAVVKVPYSNAGQGVFTIVNKSELDAFMAQRFKYDRFIVQSLIGNYQWSSTSSSGKFYHIGTMPSSKRLSYVADLRLMIQATNRGFRPLAFYARRAAKPLVETLSSSANSWSILGTNLSYKTTDGNWGTDTNRLLLVDRRDFNKLGIGLDDLIDGFIQTVLATIAIDKLAQQFLNDKGRLRHRLFRSLNDDSTLINEIMDMHQ